MKERGAVGGGSKNVYHLSSRNVRLETTMSWHMLQFFVPLFIISSKFATKKDHFNENMERMFTEGTEGGKSIVINFYNVKVGGTNLSKFDCFEKVTCFRSQMNLEQN